jgi:uncharacterized protein
LAVWTCYAERSVLGVAGIAIAVMAVGLCLLGFERLRHCGAVLAGEATRGKNSQ